MSVTNENWDPLDLQNGAASEIVAAASKRQIRNILKSYVGFFDPFCELIQNALDAVDTRERALKEKGYQKRIWITIDLKKNQLSVTDNGIGFSESQFKLCLTPSISFKNSAETRGNKGVGATYLAYGFNYLQMGTKTPEFSSLKEIQGGREWVDDNQATVSRPLVRHSKAFVDAYAKVDRGSTFTLIFKGNVRPKSLDWIGATTADQWKVLLLVKTPLGQIRSDAKDEDTLFDLEVVDTAGKKTNLQNEPCIYNFPHLVVKGTARVSDILKEQKQLVEKGKDPSKLPAKFKRLKAVYDFWSTDALCELQLTDEEKSLLKQHYVWAYSFFCYSAPKVLDYYNDEVAKLRKGIRIVRGGLQLATNSMPQGELITIPLTSNIGYQNQSHVIVHVEKADPDLGRKGFQPELQKLGERLGVSLVNKLKQWRYLMLTDKGPGDLHQDDLTLDEWITTQKDYEKKHPIELKNENFFIPINDISITAAPSSEQDVVALFNQLVAGGVIRGVQLMASSSHQQYDGLFRYHLRPPLKNHIYDEKLNPLGIQSSNGKEGFRSKPYVLEFKHCFDQLIADFENEEKSESAIQLAIVWEMGERYKERYQAVSILLPENLHSRQFHGVTHELHDEDTGVKRMDVIVLSDLIEHLNDAEKSIKSQTKKYQES